jgi:hypothetical protein
MDGYPRTVEVGALVPQVMCKPYGTSGEHCWSYLPEDPGMVAFVFFSLAASQAIMLPSCSMAALANLL